MQKRLVLLVFICLAVSVAFISCDKDDDNGRKYGSEYTFSFLPVSDEHGGALQPAYAPGEEIKIKILFKAAADDEVTKVDLLWGVVVDGNVQEKHLAATYTEFGFNDEVLQHELIMTYIVPEEGFHNARIRLFALISSKKERTQERALLTFTVLEPFDVIIEGIPYYYMFDNTFVYENEDAGLYYTVDHSAGYTVMTMLLHFYGFDPENANFINELDGNIANHSPDWAAEYYVSIWPGITANNVHELNRAYNLEADWYGSPMRLQQWNTHSIEDGTYEQIDEAILSGKPVIVHGDFRSGFDFQHQIILVAANSSDFLALDPAGEWNQQVNGNYSQDPSVGAYIQYSKEAVYAAIGESGSVNMHIPVPADKHEAKNLFARPVRN